MADLHRPAGSLVDGADPVALTPEEAGWSYCGLRVLALADGERRVVATGPDEAVVLPLSTTGLTVEADGERFVLAGRPSVFARVTDFAYVGRDTTVTLDRGGRRERWRWRPPAAPRSGRLGTARPRRCRSSCGAPASPPAR